jgi:hypothetical protein
MNRIIQLLRAGFIPQMIEVSGDIENVPAGQYLDGSVDVGYEKLAISSIEVTCDKNANFIVEFFEEAARTNSRYNSGEVTLENYDQINNLPYRDKEGTTFMYFRIHNLSNVPCSYHIEVRGTPLK